MNPIDLIETEAKCRRAKMTPSQKFWDKYSTTIFVVAIILFFVGVGFVIGNYI